MYDKYFSANIFPLKTLNTIKVKEKLKRLQSSPVLTFISKKFLEITQETATTFLKISGPPLFPGQNITAEATDLVPSTIIE